MHRANGSQADHPRAHRQPTVAAQLGQNKYLAAGDGTVPAHAILTVEADGLDRLTARAGSAEVIVIDCSGSMNWPSTKIAAARRAAAAAVDVLRDGTRFALVEGTEHARVVYPPGGRMAVAGPDTRADATHVATGLVAAGGTAIGAWLSRALDLLTGQDAPIRHTLLLTDGRNEHDPPGRLESVLADCAAAFTCDARGIGDEWAATELREIATRLHGVADAVEDDSDLEAEFRAMMTTAMAKALPDMRIRVSLREGSELRFLKQVFPTELDLTAEGVRTGELTWEFPTGAWGDEARDFHLCVATGPDGDPRGQDLQLALVALVTGPAEGGGAVEGVSLPAPRPMLLHWTDDHALSTRIHPRVAHYGGYADLGRAVIAGCEAYERGARESAEREWGRAVRLAHELGDEKVLRRLGRLVHVTDLPRGAVRVRGDVAPGDLNAAWVTADHSTQWTAPSEPADRPPRPVPAARRPAPDRRCPNCERLAAPADRHCAQCRYLFPEAPGASDTSGAPGSPGTPDPPGHAV
ncbi:VWA domain-containing protein [Streptomyces sp. HU2014]|uniref:von Willebrand factor A n=1 Tax=Streptomyces albireticuli TaxID=1940 RepID=A0A1Z2L5K1_9ACTN|nr:MULTISPECIES: VWA domain-containing protein [Streptomyces]ARZ69584.1 von Willebrand factor A [Streptomyces albireticuli]UQI43203.1 VWA domain-containing protein [Streptomyces sp. HU2014]